MSTEVYAVNREDSDGYTYSATTTEAVFSTRPLARSAAAKLVRAIRASDRKRWPDGRPRTLHSGRNGGGWHRITVEPMPLDPTEITP